MKQIHYKLVHFIAYSQLPEFTKLIQTKIYQ